MEDVNVMLPEEAELQPVGTISSIVQQLGTRTQTDTHTQISHLCCHLSHDAPAPVPPQWWSSL